MPKSNVSLHAKRARLKDALAANPDDAKAAKKVGKLTARIQAGDDRSNENLQQRFRRVKAKAKISGRTEQRAERLQAMKDRIKNPRPGDTKLSKKMRRPKSNAPFTY